MTSHDDSVLSECIARALNLPAEKVPAEASPTTLPEWDSLSHIFIVLQVEKQFKVRFATEEIPELNSLAKLRAAIASHRADGSST